MTACDPEWASGTASKKLYAVALDVSPSEQIGDHDQDIFCLGVLFGLKSPRSFDQVGRAFPIAEKRISLRKYSASSAAYKRQLAQHFLDIKNSGHVPAGVSISNQRHIRAIGLPLLARALGPIPPPSSYSKKGRPRVMLGGYTVGDEVWLPYEVLLDDLVVLGWLAAEIVGLHSMLCEVNEDLVRLDVLLDKLPNEKGPHSSNKAELLKAILERLAPGHIRVVGHPDLSDTYQRDLLVDNIAGHGRNVFMSTNHDEARSLRGRTFRGLI